MIYNGYYCFHYVTLYIEKTLQCAITMRWTDIHDILFLREIMVGAPFTYPKGSNERGQVWVKLADELRQLTEYNFYVNGRSLRDHYNLLEIKHRKGIASENSASGIAPTHSEIDVAMEELIELFKQSDENSLEHKAAKKRKLDDVLSKGLEMRQKSLETYGETMHRNGETP